ATIDYQTTTGPDALVVRIHCRGCRSEITSIVCQAAESANRCTPRSSGRIRANVQIATDGHRTSRSYGNYRIGTKTQVPGYIHGTAAFDQQLPAAPRGIYRDGTAIEPVGVDVQYPRVEKCSKARSRHRQIVINVGSLSDEGIGRG